MEDIDYKGYDKARFASIARDLHGYCMFQKKRTLMLISKLESGDASFDPPEKRDLLSDVTMLQKCRMRFIASMMKLEKGQKISVKEIEDTYDAYCYSLAMLEAHADKWEVVIANNFLKKFLDTIKIINSLIYHVGTVGKDLDKALKLFEKELNKAEKAETVSYIKAALSVALDVAIVVSPHVRALSVIGKIVVGGTISISSNLLFDNPKSYIGTTVGITVAGAELEYSARGLKAASKALGVAGKALKYNGLVGAAKDIKKSRKTVKEIEAKIASLQKLMDSKAKFLKKWAKDLDSRKHALVALIVKMQKNADKADRARETYQMYKALRERL